MLRCDFYYQNRLKFMTKRRLGLAARIIDAPHFERNVEIFF